MLTIDLLKQNEATSNLTEEQMAAIAELSKNDEGIVIAAKTREIWDTVDKDILDVTGEKKETSVKSYDHFKTILTGFKTKADSVSQIEATNATLKAEKLKLEKAIADGNGDEALKTQLADVKKKFNDSETLVSKLRTDMAENAKKYEKGLSEKDAKNVDLKFDGMFGSTLGNLVLMDIPEVAKNSTIAAAKQATKKLGTPTFKKNDDGTESIIFTDENDQVVTNPKNGHRPMTAKEFFEGQLKDIIDVKRTLAGGGLKNLKTKNESGLDLSSVKTKDEANTEIARFLAAEGVPAGSSEYKERQSKIYEENEVEKLPLV